MKNQKSPALTAEQYRAILLAKRAELMSAAGKTAPGQSELERVAEDDQAPALLDQFVSVQVKNLDYRTLRQIDAALNRLASGEFGVCGECGEDISPKRLAAIPWAQCCIACQERAGSSPGPSDNDQRAA